MDIKRHNRKIRQKKLKTMDNQFYPYHADIMRIFQQSGFRLHDVIIVKWKSCIGACFASQHEYLVVGKKC